MEIVIIRHGRSILNTSGKVSASEFGNCVREYDIAGIDESYPPSMEVIEKASSCKFVVCSDLERSLHSARLLQIEKPDLISALYRECEIPYANWDFPRIAKTVWPVVFRTLQILGYSSNAESYKEIKQRARECADQLVELAQLHGSVLYIGHGALNWVLHKSLHGLGWSGPEKSVREHWAYGVYKNIDT
jgi:broad specificity phosphatase PhoE